MPAKPRLPFSAKIPPCLVALICLIPGSAQAQIPDPCPTNSGFHCVYAGNPTAFSTFFFDVDTNKGSQITVTTIPLGDTVRWWETLANGGGNAHTSTSGSCVGTTCTAGGTGPGGTFSWDLPGGGTNMVTDHAYERMFTAAGTYNYFCRPHGFAMQGQVVVNKGSAGLSLSVSPLSSSNYGDIVTLTANVSSTIVQPTGQVTFLDNGSSISSTINLISGQATFTIQLLSAGAHSLSFSYSGDSNFNSATSASQAYTVTQASSSTGLITSGTPSTPGQSVTFTATVTSPSSITPDGSVTFNDNGTALPCSPVTLTAGSAACSTSSLTPGTHPITAVYVPANGNFAASTSNTVSQVVQDFALNISPTVVGALPGATASFNGSLTQVGGFNSPVSITCASLPANLTCTAPAGTITPPVSGGTPFTVTARSSIAAAYNFIIRGTGGGITHDQPVTLNVGSFTLTAPAPNPINVVPNAAPPTTATAYFEVQSQGTFSLPVTLTCTPNTGLTCASGSFSPSNTVTPPAGGAVSVKLNLGVTTAPPATTSATIQGSNGGTNSNIVTANVHVNNADGTIPDLRVTVTRTTVPNKAIAILGQTIQYDLTVHANQSPSCSYANANLGYCDAHNTQLLVQFSEPVSNVKAIPTQGTCDTTSALASDNLISCSLQTICVSLSFPGCPASQSVPLSFTVPLERSVSISAQVSSSGTEQNPADNSASNTTPIRHRPLARTGLTPKTP